MLLVWVKDERNLRVNFIIFLFFCVYLLLLTEVKYGNAPVDGGRGFRFGWGKGSGRGESFLRSKSSRC